MADDFSEVIGALKHAVSERNVAIHGTWKNRDVEDFAVLFGLEPLKLAEARLKKRGSNSVSTLRTERLTMVAEDLQRYTSKLFRLWVDSGIDPGIKKVRRRLASAQRKGRKRLDA